MIQDEGIQYAFGNSSSVGFFQDFTYYSFVLPITSLFSTDCFNFKRDIA